MNGLGRRLVVPAAFGLIGLVACTGTLWAAGKERAPAPPAAAPQAVRAEPAEAPPLVKKEAPAPAPSHAKVEGIPSEEALKLLLDGNERVVKGMPRAPNRTAQRRQELAAGQRPFAVVVACSDSRVPPELLFDQGYGDLFVVRTAGNVVDAVALGSIEYAVEHLGAPDRGAGPLQVRSRERDPAGRRAPRPPARHRGGHPTGSGSGAR